MAHNAFSVRIHGKEVDTVFDQYADPQEVRRRLIDHDGYAPDIEVEPATTTDLRSLIDLQRSYGLARGDIYRRASALAITAGCADEARECDALAERLLVAVCRAADPSSRGERIWRWTLSTSRRAEKTDRIDGTTATWCNSYPMTRRAYAIIAGSVREHLRHLREVLAAAAGMHRVETLGDDGWRPVDSLPAADITQAYADRLWLMRQYPGTYARVVPVADY